MAKFEIDELKNWKRSAILWGALGLGGSILFTTPILWLVLATGFGCTAGAVSASFLSRKKSIPAFVNFLALAALIALIWNLSELKGIRSHFFLGALFVAAERATLGLLGDRIVKGLNDRYRGVLSALEPRRAPIGPPPEFLENENPTEAFLEQLPEPMRSEFSDSVQEVISIHPFRSLESLAPTHSCFGGAPFLASDQEWPSREGEPLDFLAQIDLSQLPSHIFESSPSGILAFFYDVENQPWGGDPEDIGAAAIIHTPQGVAGKTMTRPGTLPPIPLRLPIGFVQSRELCLREDQEDRFYQHFRSLSESEKEPLEDAHDLLGESSSGYSRILSPPNRIQGDMDSELATANQAYGLPVDTAWIMILQLDSVDELDWQWGDSGCLYFYLPTEDLGAGRFDRPWVVLQCH